MDHASYIGGLVLVYADLFSHFLPMVYFPIGGLVCELIVFVMDRLLIWVDW